MPPSRLAHPFFKFQIFLLPSFPRSPPSRLETMVLQLISRQSISSERLRYCGGIVQQEALHLQQVRHSMHSTGSSLLVYLLAGLGLLCAGR